jgi:Na+/H+ antiporter NhaC
MVAERAINMDPAPGVVPNPWAGVAPILTFVLVTLGSIVYLGVHAEKYDGSLLSILQEGSGSTPLMYGSLSGFALALVASLALRCRLGDVLKAALRVVLGMGIAILILYHAWMIGEACTQLGTASYLTALLGDSLDPRLLPAALFVLSGFVAFSTGSSWSTMSILLPIVVGLAYGLGQSAGFAPTPAESGMYLMLMSIGAVLEGAIFGDHCSPISDTTVMSSIASSADHVDHVRTQIPYALLTMSIAMFAGYLPCAYCGISPWLGLACGALGITAAIFALGRRADEPAFRVAGGNAER